MNDSLEIVVGIQRGIAHQITRDIIGIIIDFEGAQKLAIVGDMRGWLARAPTVTQSITDFRKFVIWDASWRSSGAGNG
jgi:hypothetical protein